MSATSGSFSDLRVRLISAVVMVVIGVLAIWAGGLVFLTLLGLVGAVMIWELSRMLDTKLANSKTIPLAMIGGAAILRAGYDSRIWALSVLFLAPAIGLVLLRRDRMLFLVYALIISFAVAGLFWIRAGLGLSWTVWLILVVVAADIGGYFFGRIVGGPKILPAISPKKTWSGTLGGWLLAALVGLGFMFWDTAGIGIVTLSVLTAFASQLGDVGESAVKRRGGVKDSSTLIPGHGGFLDRFDGLIGGALFALLWAIFLGLPAGGMA